MQPASCALFCSLPASRGLVRQLSIPGRHQCYLLGTLFPHGLMERASLVFFAVAIMDHDKYMYTAISPPPLLSSLLPLWVAVICLVCVLVRRLATVYMVRAHSPAPAPTYSFLFSVLGFRFSVLTVKTTDLAHACQRRYSIYYSRSITSHIPYPHTARPRTPEPPAPYLLPPTCVLLCTAHHLYVYKRPTSPPERHLTSPLRTPIAVAPSPDAPYWHKHMPMP